MLKKYDSVFDTTQVDEVTGQIMAVRGGVLCENGNSLVDASGAAEQLGDVRRRVRGGGLGVGAGTRDRFLRPPPALQQLRLGPGCRPPASGNVRRKHLQRLGLASLVAEQLRPGPRAEPFPVTGPDLHLLAVAELKKDSAP
ncbi:hypothetical protein [Streptomyces sp. NPDC059816]|uniref:hypothetical protein n=1 Tax=Streptomyces sp. NPDC059816 TaxID=3346960 RepID=UPI00366691A8